MAPSPKASRFFSADLVVPGVIFSTRVPKAVQMQHRETDPPTAPGEDRLQDLPDWLQPFTEGLVERESGSSGSAGETTPKTPSSAHTSEDPSTTSGGKHWASTQFKHPQRYFLGYAWNGEGGWRRDPSRLLKNHFT